MKLNSRQNKYELRVTQIHPFSIGTSDLQDPALATYEVRCGAVGKVTMWTPVDFGDQYEVLRTKVQLSVCYSSVRVCKTKDP